MPPLALVTSALALEGQGEQFLMTRLSQRGWDIPGGHIEPGESPEETVRREVLEETGATLAHLELFAHQEITLLGKVPPGYRYPFPQSYQLFYLCDVAAVGCFKPTAEALESALFTNSPFKEAYRL